MTVRKDVKMILNGTIVMRYVSPAGRLVMQTEFLLSGVILALRRFMSGSISET